MKPYPYILRRQLLNILRNVVAFIIVVIIYGIAGAEWWLGN